MDEKILRQMFDEMLSSLETLETKCSALLQFVKDHGIATDEELAHYLEQAGNASEIRGRAARLRMSSLISSAMKPDEELKPAGTEKADGGAEQAVPEKADGAKARGAAEPTVTENAKPRSNQSDEEPSDSKQTTADLTNAPPTNAKASDAKPSDAQSSTARNGAAARELASEPSQPKIPGEKEVA